MKQRNRDAFARWLPIWTGLVLISLWFVVAYGSVGATANRF